MLEHSCELQTVADGAFEFYWTLKVGFGVDGADCMENLLARQRACFCWHYVPCWDLCTEFV